MTRGQVTWSLWRTRCPGHWLHFLISELFQPKVLICIFAPSSLKIETMIIQHLMILKRLVWKLALNWPSLYPEQYYNTEWIFLIFSHISKKNHCLNKKKQLYNCLNLTCSDHWSYPKFFSAVPCLTLIHPDYPTIFKDYVCSDLMSLKNGSEIQNHFLRLGLSVSFQFTDPTFWNKYIDLKKGFINNILNKKYLCVSSLW